MKKRLLIGCGIIVSILILSVWVWKYRFSSTRIAFVHYQVVSLGQISKANDNSFIKIKVLSTEELDRIGRYDMVFIDGMGLRITEEERELIRKAVSRGIPVLTTSATNPANKIISVDSVHAEALRGYLENGGIRNYRNMLNYVRKYIDRKAISVREPAPVVKRGNDMIYHALSGEDEEKGFNTVAGYHDFLKEKGLWKEEAPCIVVTGSMGEPSGLIAALEDSGYRVYPVRSIWNFIGGKHMDTIAPVAVINMAHGRMGDYVSDYIAKNNILLFSPLNTGRLVEEWEKDKMGMNGGFLSQSVVTPEIDGAIRPFALFAHYEDEEGLQHVFAVPERLETFVRTVNNYIALRTKPNADKRVAVYYYKGAGQNALTAGGMEVGPSLYNLLKRMQREGYNVAGLPASSGDLERMIQEGGAVFGDYAEGASGKFMENGNPELISKTDYETWTSRVLRPDKYAEVVRMYGEFPGTHMTTPDGKLGIARLQFGNVVLLPQNAAGKGDNSFKVVHGTDAAPPHSYIASYLWVQFGFKADILIHFGTHGSLEFTPRKQVALSSKDWPDRLVGALPHFYIYTIGNVGEGMTAKRRSYAGLQSHLTSPFMESGLRGEYKELENKLRAYNRTAGGCSCGKHDHDEETHAHDKEAVRIASLEVKAMALKLGIHRALELDSIPGKPYTEEDILRIENFAEELATEKITGQLYTLGEPYERQRILSSVRAMAVDPVAYGLFALDKLRGRTDEAVVKHKSIFARNYLEPAEKLVRRLTERPSMGTDELICRTAGIKAEELTKAREILTARNRPRGMGAMSGMRRGEKPREYTKAEIDFALAVTEVERSIKNVGNYIELFENSPEKEMQSMMNAMRGGYTKPSPGGDPIANPNTLPTGRNLYAINAEATPGEGAWEKGVRLAENTISTYRRRHNDSLPRKVSYTLWSSEFIETEGATIAQVLYMLGVEPIRDSFGRVTDLRLIPSRELGRPRIDVVVQTSGQLRDLAASRLFLINRAVEMAAGAGDDVYENYVKEGIAESERALLEKGLSPKEAREVSVFRVFGGLNGGYGTGIQSMVMSGDRWESEKEIAGVYLNNMGAYYGNEKKWEDFRTFAFESALTRTDVVVHPRQSNTWGALSLDHVYEFMGGLNLAVRNVTGKDPDAYMSDYRNRNNVRIQEVKESIGVESRTTIFNPVYIKEKMKGEAGSAGVFAEFVRNTYGWNVMKPKIIDKEMWNEIYEVYVKDKFGLGLRNYFETRNPAALEEITAVMLETIRKGMWKAGESRTAEIAGLHAALVNKYKPSCSGFVCDNAKLRRFIASRVEPEAAAEYDRNIDEIRESASEGKKKGVVMKKEERETLARENTDIPAGLPILIAVGLTVGIAVLIIRRRRRNSR